MIELIFFPVSIVPLIDDLVGPSWTNHQSVCLSYQASQVSYFQVSYFQGHGFVDGETLRESREPRRIDWTSIDLFGFDFDQSIWFDITAS